MDTSISPQIYVLIGLMTYPVAMDMWYRVCHKRCEFYAPNSINWYFGFIAYALFWPIALPLLTYSYLKEMGQK